MVILDKAPMPHLQSVVAPECYAEKPQAKWRPVEQAGAVSGGGQRTVAVAAKQRQPTSKSQRQFASQGLTKLLQVVW